MSTNNELNNKQSLDEKYKIGLDLLKKKDYDNAIKYFEESASQGNSEAIYQLGKIYYYGKGVEKNYQKAKEYFEKNEIIEHVMSIYYLGIIYYYGRGITKNIEIAKEYFTKSANKEHYNSRFYLAEIAYNESDYKLAKSEFEEFAQQDDMSAIYYLNEIYRNGYDCEIDIKKADEYLNRIETRYLNCLILFLLMLDKENYDEIFEIMKISKNERHFFEDNVIEIIPNENVKTMMKNKYEGISFLKNEQFQIINENVEKKLNQYVSKFGNKFDYKSFNSDEDVCKFVYKIINAN